MKQKIDFEQMAHTIWKVVEPGTISWENTEFTIEGNFEGMPTFTLYHNGNLIELAISLSYLKQRAQLIASQMIAMGVEP